MRPSFLPALGAAAFLAFAPPALADGHTFSGPYIAGEVGFDLIDQGGSLSGADGTSFAAGVGLGYGMKLSELMGSGDFMGMPADKIYLGGEVGIYYGSFDQGTDAQRIQNNVGNTPATFFGDNVEVMDASDVGGVDFTTDGILLDNETFDATVTERIDYEENFRFNVTGDIGYLVSSNVLGFIRLGFGYANVDGSVTTNIGVAATQDGGLSGAEVTALTAEQRAALVGVARAALVTEREANDNQGTDEVALAPSVEDGSSSFLIGVGGEYALGEGLSARAHYLYNVGSERDSSDFRFALVWRF